MVQFKKVDPDKIDNTRRGRRGRVSYPILKGFLETGLFLAELDRTGMQQSLQSLYSTLGSYIRNHKMPIKLFQRQGELYLTRLDVDKDGNQVEHWKEEAYGISPNLKKEATPINVEEVQKRFDEEKGKTTK